MGGPSEQARWKVGLPIQGQEGRRHQPAVAARHARRCR